MTELLVVTCTYRKPHRLNYLKECVRTFRQVAFMRWIVVEDGRQIDPDVKDLLEAGGMTYVYLHTYSRSYGNAQKNLALTYIRDHGLKGVVYVADDDNVYDIRLFEEIRKTRKISVFPVGNLGPNGIERPILKDGKIVGWDADWRSRKYPVDQGGYAINAQLLYTLKDPIWSHLSYGGESEFIDKLIRSQDELEILCDACRECYMWHNYLLLPWPLRYPISKTKVMATKALRKLGVTFPGERL